ncbi:CARP [Balamuthia mandrillaris]
MGVPKLVAVGPEAVTSSDFDAVVLVVPDAQAKLQHLPFHDVVERTTKVDAAFAATTNLVVVDEKQAAGGRLVFSPTGPLSRDQDDVRRYADAAKAGVLRAKKAGSLRPLLVVAEREGPLPEELSKFLEVSLLAALAALYEPLQAREHLGEQQLEPTETVGFVIDDQEKGNYLTHVVSAMEHGRRVARDIGSADPERMTPHNAAKYLTEAFNGSGVSVEVVADLQELKKEYPLAYAVGRCSTQVDRHSPCIVRLEYAGEGEIDETLLLAGKGIVYDTGGADIKYGGHMAGMHMDKGGAAGVAGFLKTVSLLKPKGVKVLAELAFVRNSSGADNYVADEIIVSHAGVRVMVGNTDAEGRMVLTDCVSHLREKALKEKNARLMTCATLTGHAGRAVGPYSITLDNGPAHAQGLSPKLQAVAHQWGDPFEISTLRREDYDLIAPKNSAYDVLQCNNLPSSMTARGHQFPAAFIIVASGLQKHGRDSEHPLCFSHLDIAGSAAEGGDYQHGKPTATPVVALTARYLLDRI